MAYIKKKWSLNTFHKGDAELINGLNHIEEGIAEAGNGKNWRDFEFTSEDLELLFNGERLVSYVNPEEGKHEEEYNPANFYSDYYKVSLSNEANYVGTPCKIGQELTKIYVDLTTPDSGIADWNKKEIHSALYKMMTAGFDHHYYKTLLLYAGVDNMETNKGWLAGNDVIDGQNVVYIQDVSKQKWEYNDNDYEAILKAREGLDTEIWGDEYVISIRGASSGANKAYLLCYNDTQSSYIDGTTSAVRWADVKAGNVYEVYFHPSSERWMLQSVQTKTGGGKEGVPAQTSVLNTLRDTGIAFGGTGANKRYIAEGVADTQYEQNGVCFGPVYPDAFIKLFSINKAFDNEAELEAMELVGRPAGYIPESLYWIDPDTEEEVEDTGLYAWHIDVEGVTVSILIPSSHLNTVIVKMGDNNSSSGSSGDVAISFPTYSSIDLYRHTIKIVPNSDATFADGDWKMTATFCSVNAQQGDSHIDYILKSDLGQSINWVLPCQGKIGQVSGGSVTTWFEIFRIKSVTNTETYAPGLIFEYFDASGNLVVPTTPMITLDNKDKYIGTDFRSKIATTLGGNYDIAPAIKE